MTAKVSTEKKAQVIALKGKGLSLRQIAEKAGVSLGSVHNILKYEKASHKADVKAQRRAKRMADYWKSWREKEKEKSAPAARKPAEAAEEGHTIARRYKLDASVVEEIKQLGQVYLSQRSAIQIGVEILARLREPLAIGRPETGRPVGMTYKLPPRTIAQIDALSQAYGTRGLVLYACTAVLQDSVKLKAIE